MDQVLEQTRKLLIEQSSQAARLRKTEQRSFLRWQLWKKCQVPKKEGSFQKLLDSQGVAGADCSKATSLQETLQMILVRAVVSSELADNKTIRYLLSQHVT
ncbi:hypothetical protein V5799_009704 [Amblyomma americanum]|uniref:Uncharacterized protein n=1 Tax=Amblyomma americanum TaxID=6943 RepID=A0AAQ4FAX9_AMBAM